MIFEDGRFYIGEFKKGMFNGKGIIYYKSGNVEYEGDFVKDRYEGKGKYVYGNGEYYIGDYKNDICMEKE